MKKVLINILPYIVLSIIIFFISDVIYKKYFFAKDIQKLNPDLIEMEKTASECDILYVGESSNTSFNPWNDSQNYSIAQFLQMYIPNKKIGSVSKQGYHLSLFEKLIPFLAEKNQKINTIVLTLNMRNLGTSALYNENEARFQQEAVFYNNRITPLMKKICISMHFYDNKNKLEREREKIKFWRLNKIENVQFQHGTVKNWLQTISEYAIKNNLDPTYAHMADAYIKEFAFVIDSNNRRIQSLLNIINWCNKNNKQLIVHILPENREYAQKLFGNELLQFMDYNVQYLQKIINSKCKLINNYYQSAGKDYTDQFYPTEHFNAKIRNQIARSIAQKILKNAVQLINAKPNQLFNKNVFQEYADKIPNFEH